MKNHKWIIPLIGGILLSISSWTLIEIIELKAKTSSIENELINVDKQFGRIFYWFDKFTDLK
ncbi:hypothetical protein OAV02_00270 [bacterium]|jgi:hypothetical protein|nr:hypothetical protein [bacterium]|tara:strand:+ start:449 stop:634 length:186 start_codon:yes stop_codon:yes gene_type:complete